MATNILHATAAPRAMPPAPWHTPPAAGALSARGPAGAAQRAGPADRRGLAEERQVSGRLGAHALTLAFVAVAVWCALVHPWPEAIYYLGIVAAFLGLAWAWGRRARRPVPSWLVLGFVLANAGLLTVTLLVPNPFEHRWRRVQMALRPPQVPRSSCCWSRGRPSPCRRGSCSARR